jgi:hypothetical protein
MFSNAIFNKFITNAKTGRLSLSVARAQEVAYSHAHAHFAEGRQLTSKTNTINQAYSNHFINDSLQYFPSLKNNLFNKELQSQLLFVGRDHLSFLSSKRHFSNDRQHEPLPRLMDFPQIAWPSIFKVIKNWILTNFIITPYFDREFIAQDFLNGSKQVCDLAEIMCYIICTTQKGKNK